MRATMGLALLLMTTAGCGGDDDDATGSPSGGDAGACTATIKLQDYKLSPTAVEVASGASVLCAVNEGQTPHDLRVRDGSKKDLGQTVVLQPGQSARLSITLQAGAYEMYCSVAGHESLGMKGPLTVR